MHHGNNFFVHGAKCLNNSIDRIIYDTVLPSKREAMHAIPKVPIRH